MQPLFSQASNLSLLILIVLMVVLNFNNGINLFGSGGLLASLILVFVILVGGYLLASLGRVENWVQSFGTGQRNFAAMVVATMNFGNQEVVMVVVYSFMGLVILTPLALE